LLSTFEMVSRNALSPSVACLSSFCVCWENSPRVFSLGRQLVLAGVSGQELGDLHLVGGSASRW